MEKSSSMTTLRTSVEHGTTQVASMQTALDMEDIRAVGIHEHKEAAQCLADAFADDEVARYFIDTEDRSHWSEQDKWDLHVSILEYVVAAHCYKGLVTTVGSNYDCVALWMPPGKNMDDWCTILRSGLWRLQYKLSWEGKQRFFAEFLPLLHHTKHAVMDNRDDNSYYLVYIGTKRSARGKGYARKLIEDVTKQADDEGRACYLESSNSINLVIYRKLGFEERRKIYLSRGKGPIALDIMVREPSRPTINETSALRGGIVKLQTVSN
ncbi:MAG: hypothetical protein M1827_002367 [Pycnora praestabilis]|nr:MAG: hypothetical protein M1827_002367 [Pycnora praestabilis]